MTEVVGKRWGFCHTLHHDGIDYGDHIEQITYLHILKMADQKEALHRATLQPHEAASPRGWNSVQVCASGAPRR
jgi:hypothetical protein